MMKFLSRHSALARSLPLLAFFVVAGFFSFESTAYAACKTGDIVCGILSVGGDILGGFFAGVVMVFVGLLSIVLGWVAVLFNFAMKVTVFQFANFFGNSTGLLLAWGVMRDLANIVLLFGFIYIGIQTILNIGNYDVKKTLPRLILFAILLNFSLFAAEAMVDIGNATAASFYHQASGIDCRGSDESCANEGITGKILQVSGLSSIFDVSDTTFELMGEGTAGLAMSVALLALITILMGVFFAGAVILVSRAVTLAILFVTSPIGFAGMAVPPLQKYADTWWKTLTENIIFAPVYLLLLLVAIKILEGMRGALGMESGTSLVNVIASGDPNQFGALFVFFALVIGFLWAALDFAKKSSVFGASAVTGMTQKWVGNTMGGATLGTLGFFGRRTIGAGSGAAARAIRRSPFGQTDLGRMASNVVGAGARQSFDLRGSKTFSSTVSAVPGLSLGGPGKAARGGIQGIVEAQQKARTEYDSALQKEDTALYNELKFERDELTRRINAAGGEGAPAAQSLVEQRKKVSQQMEATAKSMDTQAGNARENETKARQKASEAKSEADKAAASREKSEAKLETARTRRTEARASVDAATNRARAARTSLGQIEEQIRTWEASSASGREEALRDLQQQREETRSEMERATNALADAERAEKSTEEAVSRFETEVRQDREREETQRREQEAQNEAVERYEKQAENLENRRDALQNQYVASIEKAAERTAIPFLRRTVSGTTRAALRNAALDIRKKRKTDEKTELLEKLQKTLNIAENPPKTEGESKKS